MPARPQSRPPPPGPAAAGWLTASRRRWQNCLNNLDLKTGIWSAEEARRGFPFSLLWARVLT